MHFHSFPPPLTTESGRAAGGRPGRKSRMEPAIQLQYGDTVDHISQCMRRYLLHLFHKIVGGAPIV